MKILFYSTRPFEKDYLVAGNKNSFEIEFTAKLLSAETASLAEGFHCISIFTADDASAAVIMQLKKLGVKYIALRCAGYDNIDLDAANENDISVANVPEYSPYSVAEHAVLLALALNRKLVTSARQVADHNFTIDRLVGFDMHQKTVGVIGMGRIGRVFARIMHGFGCTVLAYDVAPDHTFAGRYDIHFVELHTLCSRADIISVHTPLNDFTKQMISNSLISKMKKGVMLINTARGGIVNTEDVIANIEKGQIGYYGADVYEKEKGIFFNDLSGGKLNDPMLEKLMHLDNVLITPHQGFATEEALTNISTTTFENILCWKNKLTSPNELTQSLTHKTEHPA